MARGRRTMTREQGVQQRSQMELGEQNDCVEEGVICEVGDSVRELSTEFYK